jgi:hypothetical protein
VVHEGLSREHVDAVHQSGTLATIPLRMYELKVYQRMSATFRSGVYVIKVKLGQRLWLPANGASLILECVKEQP